MSYAEIAATLGISVKTVEVQMWRALRKLREHLAVYLFEPAVGAEIKLARIVRLGLGVGYRLVGNVDTPGLRDSDLRGVTGTATLRLGWF